MRGTCFLLLAHAACGRCSGKGSTVRWFADSKTVTPFKKPPKKQYKSVPLPVEKSGFPLLPPQVAEHVGRPTIVLDLDETLVYARESIVHPRPYLDEFLRSLKDAFETVVWTAGLQEYADYALSQVDPLHIIAHRICRDSRWFPEDGLEHDRLYTKKLNLLGRNVDRTIMIENAPECCLDARMHSILLPDFECRNIADRHCSSDTMLLELIPLMKRFAESGMPTPAFIKKLHEEGLLKTNEFINATAGDLGRFYHIGLPTRTKPAPPPTTAWPKVSW